MPKRFYLFASLLLLTSASADTIKQLKPLVVKGARLPLDAFAQVGSTTKITSEEIEEKQYYSLFDALKEIPGGAVVQSGGIGQPSSLFLRGTNSNHTLVLADGVEINDPSDPSGAFNFSTLFLNGRSAIEVIRGPLSSAVGSDAIGGVVSVTTPKGNGDHKTFLATGAGSFRTWTKGGGIQGEKGKLNYNTSLAHQQSMGIRTIASRLLSATANRQTDPYHNTSLVNRMGVDLNDACQLTLFNRYIETSLGYHSFGAIRRTYSRNQNHRLQFDASVLQDHWKHILAVSYVDTDRWDNDEFARQIAMNMGKRTKAEWRQKMILSNWYEIDLGIEGQRETFTSKTNFSQGMGGRTRQGYFMTHQFYPSDPLTLVVSGRLDKTSSFSFIPTYRLSAGYRLPFFKTHLKVSYGAAFKAPSLFELFGVIGNFRGNPFLQPEKSRGWEIGAEQPFWDERVTVGITYFQNRIHNLITSNVTFTTSENINRTYTDGTESFVSFQVLDAFSLRLDHTYTRARDLTKKKPLLRRPKHKLSITIDWRPTEKTSIFATGIYQGRREDIDAVTYRMIRKGGYTTITVGANYDASQTIKVFGRIENLLNRRYEDPDGYNKPGFAGFIGVKADL
jgi:vitamin B12 transporter